MITAGDLLRAFDARTRSATLAQIDNLLGPERDAVEAAVKALPPGCTVDVGKLIMEARARATERDVQRLRGDPRDLMSAFRYRLRLASKSELEDLRDELETAHREGQTNASLIVQRFLGRCGRVARRLSPSAISATPARRPSDDWMDEPGNDDEEGAEA